MSRIDQFVSICETLRTIYITKNADYGNSFDDTVREFGIVAAVVRMSDKMERLKTLSKTNARVKGEAISDTLRDLANYAIMTLMAMEAKDGDL